MLSQTGPTQFISYPSVNGGWTKTFATATRPVDDIDISLNSTFILNDGFDGGATYTNTSNNFKFGSNNVGQNPLKNFFGLPILSKTSTNIINYSIGFDNLDSTWWPASGNLIADLKLYLKGTTVANAPGPSGFINWNNQSVTKAWNNASSSGFPRLPVASDRSDTLTGTFNFNGNTSTSFSGNKYSRDLMDTTYTPTTNTPLFHIEASYDNNLLRQNRGISSSSLENNSRRSLDARFSSGNENRFEGKGVGPNGSYTLFWDHTFNTNTTFQNVGEIGASSPYNEYPFCQIGISPNFATTFDHTIIMTGQIANKQLMWAKDGFKHGSWSTASENPYIDYTNKYWFGNHTSTLTVNYSSNNSTGETLGSTATTYNSADITPWYDNSSPSSFDIFKPSGTSLSSKVLVIKVTKPTTAFSTSLQPCCSLELELDGTFTYWPDVTPNQAGNGDKPLVWMLEDKGSTSTSFTVTTSSGYTTDRTGWKATHKREDTAGQGQATMNENNMGCLVTDALHTSSGDNTGDKIFNLTGGKQIGYDIYFRILIPNKSNSSNNLSGVRVKFYNRNTTSGVLSQISGTVTKTWTQ